MNRVEKMKKKKQNRIRRIKGFFAGILFFTFLITLLYIGLEIVDETNRTMMSMDNPCFFSYKKFDENHLEVIFCGDKYLVNVEKIDGVIEGVKEKTKHGIINIRRFSKDKGKILSKLIEDIFNGYEETFD